ncbi:MAG: hypothetical protein KatS3mg129_2598 [Leptospiraceae bacterium]|nr:MAG: hypothetical protein KatS3mg129_2598 [Leptospiraceae bacterium]
MIRNKVFIFFIMFISFSGLLISQTTLVSSNNTTVLKKPTDSLRECKEPEKYRKTTPDKLILPDIAWGNNPQEVEYREEIIRLLKIEIANVEQAIKDLVNKHKELIKLYPELKEYQEIILEDNPGSWRDGIFVNSKKVLALHYNSNGEIDCIVLDSMIRGVDQYEWWTRKIMRIYYPSIQTIQLETLRQNFRMLESLENSSPEIQLKALRKVFINLRTALYSMDMMIAAYYDRRNKKHDWQIGL